MERYYLKARPQYKNETSYPENWLDEQQNARERNATVATPHWTFRSTSPWRHKFWWRLLSSSYFFIHEGVLQFLLKYTKLNLGIVEIFLLNCKGPCTKNINWNLWRHTVEWCWRFSVKLKRVTFTFIFSSHYRTYYRNINESEGFERIPSQAKLI